MLPQVWLLTAAATVRPWRREGENLPEGQVERFRREAIVWRPPPGIRCRLTDGRQAVVCGPLHTRGARWPVSRWNGPPAYLWSGLLHPQIFNPICKSRASQRLRAPRLFVRVEALDNLGANAAILR